MIMEPLPTDVAASLDASARGFGVPGMALALVTPGRRLRHVFGVDAPHSQVAVAADTWFSLASVAKHATAMAVLELAQESRLALDGPIGASLPGLPAAWARRSIDSLLRHTSGLPEYLGPDEDAVPETRAAFIERYGARPTVFEEGEGWIYSNTNYIVLAFLVAHLRGTSFAAVIDRTVAGFGARGVAVAGSQWTRDANRDKLGAAARDGVSRGREVIGDGDLSMTVDGAADWLHGLLGGAALAEPWRSRMWSPALLRTGRPAPYGYGWFVDRLGAEPICHHAGHFDGWTAIAYLAPSRGCGVIAMCNLAPRNTRAMRAVAQRALEAIAPGTTPLGLTPIADGSPALTETARAQLLRNGTPIDPGCFADELLRVSARGGEVRNVIDVWAGVAPERFELVEEQRGDAHRFRRYRMTYVDRTEHLLVGTTADDRIFWAWPL